MITLILAFLIPICFIMCISFAGVLFSGRRLEDTICITFLVVIAVLFPMGFIDLRIGMSICIFIGLISILYIIKHIKNNGISTFMRMIFTPSVIGYLIVYVFVFVINLGKDFSHWDEISHWGMMAKDLYYTNRYYIFESARLSVHNEYPPLMALIEYLWCKLSLGYSESYLYTGKMMVCFSMLLPVISKATDAKKVQPKIGRVVVEGVIKAVILILLPLVVIIGEATFYRTIYAESVMVILFGCSYFDFIDNDCSKGGVFKTALLLSALSITKQIAIYFVGIIILLWCVRIIYNWIKEKQRIISVANTLRIITPLITMATWKVATNLYCSTGQFDIKKNTVTSVFSVISGNDSTYKSEVMKKYLNYIWEYDLSIGRFHISYILMALFIPLVVFLIVLISKNENKLKLIWPLCVIEIFYIGYIAVMLFTYLYGFSEYEAMGIACYPRYMNTMVFCIVVIGILQLYQEINRSDIYRDIMLAIICIIIIDPISFTDELGVGLFYDSSRHYFEGDAEVINNNTPDDSKIYAIYQDSNGSANNWLAYLTYPRIISRGNYSLGLPYTTDDVYTKNISVNEFKKYAEDYDYIYLGTVDDKFEDAYGEMFSDVKNQVLYEVDDVTEVTFKEIYSKY